MKKFVTLSLAVALGIPMFAESLRIFKCSEDGIPGQTEPQLMGFSMSANGRYVCGAIEMAAGIFIADCETGEVKWKAMEESGGELRSVDDNGVGIGILDDHGTLFSFATEEETMLKVPEGYRYVQGEGISNDGSIKVGSLTGSSFDTKGAYSTQEDKWEILPMPTDQEAGDLKEFYNESFSAAKFVSGDGRVIMGHVGSFTFPIVWTRNETGEYVADFFPARFVKTVENDNTKELYNISGMYTCMSHNGKYVGTVGLVIGGPNNDNFLVPVIYNTEEKTLKIYSETQEIDELGIGLFPRAIADDGTFVGTVGQPQTGSTGSFIMKAGQEQAELFVDAFPAYAEKLGPSDEAGYNVPTGISADGNNILGYTYYSDDLEMSSDAPAYYLTYVISLAGSGVDHVDGEVKHMPVSVYSIDGRPLSRMQKGLNIVRKTDGNVCKILNK